ncbi:hypothetical protein AB0J80_30820 [Actinoplanes sp. NPDC049548]|uniref:hypothetical protein n=1 Tax=Actinoplanes sp. NPDC049548 TaxID=3155152 RepID=UPI003418D6CB
MNDDDLRGLLGRAAAEHHPDRAAMLDRMAQRLADLPAADRSVRGLPASGHRPQTPPELDLGRGPRASRRRPLRPRIAGRASRAQTDTRRTPRWQLARVAGAALAVSAVIGVGGVARWAFSRDADTHGTPAAPPVVTLSRTPTTAPPTSPTPEASASPQHSRRPSRNPSSPAQTGGSRAEPGALWADGSVVTDGDRAARSEITLKLDEPATALEVTVRVRQTAGLTDQGAVHDVTGTRIDSTIVHQPDFLVYRFTLAAGEKLAEGTHVFAARYLQAKGGRDAGDDTYEVVATTVGGRRLTVSGDFF